MDYQAGKDIMQLTNAVNMLTAELKRTQAAVQETRDILDKLAAHVGLDYNAENKQWERVEHVPVEVVK